MDTTKVVKEKLDRNITNQEWLESFYHATLKSLSILASDHYPILLSWSHATYRSSHSHFKFKNAWLVEYDFHKFVCERWHSFGQNLILNKLSMCVGDLSHWSKGYSQSLEKDIT